MGKNIKFISLLMLLLFSSIIVMNSTTMARENNQEIRSTQQDIDTIVYAMPYDFADFSQFTVDSYSSEQWISAVYTGLLRRDAQQDNSYVPDLAESYTIIENTDGGLKITVDLKPDLKFATGGELTAEDVAFSYHVALTPSINTYTYRLLSSHLESNASVSVIDHDTVEIITKSNYVFAESLLTQGIIEKNLYEQEYIRCLQNPASEICDWDDPQGYYTVSAGPFLVDNIDTINGVVTLKKNEHYYNAANVLTDQLIFKQIPTTEEAISALESGEIDIMDSHYVPGIDAFLGLDGVTNVIIGDPSHEEISLNHLNGYYGDGTSIEDGDNNDNSRDALNIRKAMSHIADRENSANSNQIFQNLGSPAATIMPTVSTGWDPDLAPREYNITQSREYMASAFADTPYDTSILTEAGTDEKCGTYDPDTDSIPHPCIFEITVLTTNTNPARNQWSSAWTLELPKIGIAVKDYVSTTWGNIIPRTFGHTDAQPLGYDQGGYDVLSIGRDWGLDWDPSGVLTKSGLCGTGSCDNFYNYVNATVEQMISDYTNEQDIQQRINYAQDLQQAMFDDVPVIPIVYTQSHWGFSDELFGIGHLLISVSQQEWDEVSKSGFTVESGITSDITAKSGDGGDYSYILIDNPVLTPQSPTLGSSITISVNITAIQDIADVTLSYWVDTGSSNLLYMTSNDGLTYTTTIPPLESGNNVTYSIEVSTDQGETNISGNYSFTFHLEDNASSQSDVENPSEIENPIPVKIYSFIGGFLVIAVLNRKHSRFRK